MVTQRCPAARAKRVLIADDDADVRALLVAALDAYADVSAVGDAEAALALLTRESPYDALICDFMLPGMTGLELVERARGEQPAIPVLMISGHGAVVLGERARAAGVNAFLDKPFSLAGLRGAVLALLHDGRPATGEHGEPPRKLELASRLV